MNTWKVILATIVIFGAGVVTGLLLVRNSERWDSRRAQHTARAAQPVSPSVMKLEFLRRVEKELDLSPEQRQTTDRIISQGQERTRKLLEPISPKLHEEIQKTKEEFRAVLTPAQRARFDQLLKQQHPRDGRRLAPGREHTLGPANSNRPAPTGP